jgi:hypothetical protein
MPAIGPYFDCPPVMSVLIFQRYSEASKDILVDIMQTFKKPDFTVSFALPTSHTKQASYRISPLVNFHFSTVLVIKKNIRAECVHKIRAVY